MSKVVITESYLEDIADAIREKNGTQSTYTPAQMATAISNISGGGGSTSWESLVDQSVNIASANPNYFTVSNYTYPFQSGQEYRVTWGSGGTTYTCETKQDASSVTYDGYYIGSSGTVGLPSDGTNLPFFIYRYMLWIVAIQILVVGKGIFDCSRKYPPSTVS